jgi:hypothetical protein
MSEAFQAGASYIASSIAQEGTAAYVAAYVAVYALEVYAFQRLTESLAGTSKPKGEGRGLEVMITDTGAAGFAIYGTVRVSGTNVIP